MKRVQILQKLVKQRKESSKIYFSDVNNLAQPVQFLSYVLSGVYHIVPAGYDHILFIIGLYLFSYQFRTLIVQVSLFTLAHSISLILAGLNSYGTTTIIEKNESRNHTEKMMKYLKLPIKIQSKKNYDLIKVKKVSKIKPLKYNIPSDISSSAFL